MNSSLVTAGNWILHTVQLLSNKHHPHRFGGGDLQCDRADL